LALPHAAEYDLGMKMASQECGLTNRLELGVRNINWKENFIHYAHFHSEVRNPAWLLQLQKIL
jgi:hypothetical protein